MIKIKGYAVEGINSKVGFINATATTDSPVYVYFDVKTGWLVCSARDNQLKEEFGFLYVGRYTGKVKRAYLKEDVGNALEIYTGGSICRA